MILKHFTYQLLPLAVSFGIGYWILITANMQQNGLKTVGKTLGWILIVVAVLASLFSYFYSIKFMNEFHLKSRGYGMMEHHHYHNGTPMMDREDKDELKVPQKDESDDIENEEETKEETK